jgi:peptide/nickel transport system substrate-binding protein
VWEEAPWVFLWVQRFPIVYSAKVTDISSLPNEMFYAKYARPVR